MQETKAETPTSRPPPPAVPQRVSSLQNREEAAPPGKTAPQASPISDCAKKLSDEMQKEMMTPRSRRPVTMVKETHEDKDGFKVRLLKLCC